MASHTNYLRPEKRKNIKKKISKNKYFGKAKFLMTNLLAHLNV